MFCSLCKKYGRPSMQARGAWVESIIATELLNKHAKSEWHMAAIKKDVMAQVAKQQGDVMERVMRISKEEKKYGLG